MTKKNTRIAVYIQGEKYHYMTDEINLATPPWTTLEMFLLVEPTECYEEDPYSEIETCGIQGEVYIPKDKVTQIIRYT